MPLKTHTRAKQKKHPKHYLKVYWPYLPLVLIMLSTLMLGRSFVEQSQQDVLSYASDIDSTSLLESTNRKRAADDRPPLRLNDSLSEAAHAKAQDMANEDYWSHVSPEAKYPWAFIDEAGYGYRKAGENLAYGFNSSREVVVGWMNSSSHKTNMLDGAYRDVGFGIVNAENFQQTGPKTIVVAMYGTPDSISSAELAAIEDQNEQSAAPAISGSTVKSINTAQIITGGSAPWITLAIGLFIGSMLCYLVVKHGIGLKRALRNSEKFVLKHPLLDLTIIALIALLSIATRSIGVIG